MNAGTENALPGWLPFAVGALLVAQFVGLGAWQVSRGLEKRAQQDLFADDSGFAAWSPGTEPGPFQQIRIAGSLGNRTFLLENIIVDGRIGYYVVTPLYFDEAAPPLLVNRGWIEKGSGDPADRLPRLDDPSGTFRGRAGSLPRAGFKMGEAIPPGQDWPKLAVYPTREDIEAALGTGVQPFVLLLDPENPHGFLRRWEPEGLGPARHFGYALQWFAMAVVLAGLLVWHYRKRRTARD